MILQQDFLKRERIYDELDHIFQFPLTIAVAAMGYGKTSAAREYLMSCNANYIWVSIEYDESSPQFIWDSFSKQIAKGNFELGNQLRTLGFPTNVAESDKIKELIENYFYLTNTVLVIDDYHFVHASAIDDLLESIIRLNIQGFHILILSRTMPALSVDDLILEDYCYLIANNYFEFTLDEINRYFLSHGFNLSQDMIEKVHEISEGWISAIYLIMQQYGETHIFETVSSIERLMETAVMSRYSEKEIMLLKLLCNFEFFSPQQAQYITGMRDAASIMYHLSDSNSFIRYDDQNGIFQIHNIFNTYLKRLLEENPHGIELESMYERSGTWCIQNGHILSGLKWFLKAQKYDLIFNEFKKNTITPIFDSNPDFILELFLTIPMEIIYQHPIAYIAYIGFYVTNVDQAIGENLLLEVERRYKQDKSLSKEMLKRIMGEITLIRAYVAFNDVSIMYEKFKSAHSLLGGQSFIANKDKIVTFGSPHILYLYYKKRDELLWTINCLEKLSPYYQELSGGCGMGFECQLRSEYYLEMGDLDKAEFFAYKAIYKARTTNQFAVVICSNFVLMRSCLAKGLINDALEIMDALSMEADTVNSPILNSTVDLCSGYIQGIRGNELGFKKWLRDGVIDQSKILYQGVGFNYIVYGQYLLQKKEYRKLELLIDDMLHSFSYFNNLFGVLHAYLQDSAAKYNLYGMEKAEESLQRAIDIARSDKIIMPFVEYGVHIIEILKKINKESQKDDYLNRIIDFSEKYQMNIKGTSNGEVVSIEFSNRELQILKSIADGKTNREIASTLFIAEVTVRKHITSIYRKLGISGRAAAVKKAIELNII